MTIEEAVGAEQERYVTDAGFGCHHLAHIRYRALVRLRHRLVTEHERLKLEVGR